MPRIKRKIGYTKVYHIILRGINKQNIFLDEKDYDKFLGILRVKKTKYEYEIYSYCLMTNHVHLLIKTDKAPLTSLMRRLNSTYAIYYNKKYVVQYGISGNQPCLS